MIEIKNLTKKYGKDTVYDNFDFDIEEGKITVILGESGAGKTTLLKILAGSLDFDGGKISGIDRPLSFVFQKDRLIPNLTMEQNLKLVKANVDRELIEKVGLTDKLDKYPRNLSGGQCRYFAILRALFFPSPVILMDEPFINLDLKLKFELIDLIKQKQREEKRTVVLVTHNIEEAMRIADRIVIISKGKKVYDNRKITTDCKEQIYNVMLNL